MHETTSMGLGHAVALLAAMVVAATLFRRRSVLDARQHGHATARALRQTSP